MESVQEEQVTDLEIEDELEALLGGEEETGDKVDPEDDVDEEDDC